MNVTPSGPAPIAPVDLLGWGSGDPPNDCREQCETWFSVTVSETLGFGQFFRL